ncbi:hypothetical protein [Sphingomonas turrisvirgatae]|uniref:hypothetical protein n=1 Tax=Sphingomonas TaxID=13687 RepID=UPI001F4D6ABB|nr:hypothetical protein [Sphingomonas turrisvirgatae]
MKRRAQDSFPTRFLDRQGGIRGLKQRWHHAIFEIEQHILRWCSRLAGLAKG